MSICAHWYTALRVNLSLAGTVEQHIGGKICCLINELSEATEQDDLQQVQDKVDKVMRGGRCSSGPRPRCMMVIC